MRRYFVLTSTILIILLIGIEMMATNIIIVPIVNAIKIPTSQSGTILMYYMLFFLMIIVVAGKLGDMYGKLKILFIGLILFNVGCLFAGIASTYWVLIVGRAFQGMGAGLMLPNTNAITFEAFSQDKRGFLIGIMSGVSSVSKMLAPVIAGIIPN